LIENEERYEQEINSLKSVISQQQKPLTEKSQNTKIRTCIIDCSEKDENKHPGFTT